MHQIQNYQFDSKNSLKTWKYKNASKPEYEKKENL